MIRVICTCGKAFKAEDRHAGRRTNCPVCGADLTVGPISATRPNGVGGDRVEAWWDRNGPAQQATRGTAPTRSGSDPGRDAVPAMVVPTGSGHPSRSHASSPSSSSAASQPAQMPPSKAPFGTPMQVAGRLALAVRNHRAIAAGAAALLLVAIGASWWLRPGTPGVDQGAAAPGGTESNKPNRAVQAPSSPPSATGRDPRLSEERTAASPTDAAGSVASPTGPKVDADGPPRASLADGSRRLQLLVPAYIYPGGDGRKDWLRLFDAASKVKIVAIANPNSGPGEERNLEYNAIFTEAGKLGITMIGYVSTNFGLRSQADVKKDVDTWLAFYPQIRGFFFDQQPREGQHASRFADLRDYVKGKLRDPVVIANPGVPCDESYLAQGVSNVTCVFVNYQGFERFELPAALQPYDPSRFAAMPYNIPDVETMREFVRDAIVKRIGYIYVSDAKQPNPWSKLPAYWEAEVDAISRLR